MKLKRFNIRTIIIISLFLFITFSVNALDQVALEIQNQLEEAETKLDQIYSEIVQGYIDDQILIAALETSQDSWLIYRDSVLEARFPKEDKIYEYGTAYNYCFRLILLNLTNQRIEELMIWIDGVPEGDVCQGSARRSSDETRQ